MSGDPEQTPELAHVVIGVRAPSRDKVVCGFIDSAGGRSEFAVGPERAGELAMSMLLAVSQLPVGPVAEAGRLSGPQAVPAAGCGLAASKGEVGFYVRVGPQDLVFQISPDALVRLAHEILDPQGWIAQAAPRSPAN